MVAKDMAKGLAKAEGVDSGKQKYIKAAQKTMRKALLGKARIPVLGEVSVRDLVGQQLLHPGFKWKFDTFNDREISETAIDRLQRSFRGEGAQPSKFPVLVMILRDDYEEWSFTPTPDGEPPILTPKAHMRTGTRVVLLFIGGGHRMTAAGRELKAILLELGALDKGLAVFAEGNEIAGLTEEILKAKKTLALGRLEQLEYWDCEVYDQGKPCFKPNIDCFRY